MLHSAIAPLKPCSYFIQRRSLVSGLPIHNGRGRKLRQLTSFALILQIRMHKIDDTSPLLWVIALDNLGFFSHLSPIPDPPRKQILYAKCRCVFVFVD